MPKSKYFYIFMTIVSLLIDFFSKILAQQYFIQHYNQGLFLGIGDSYFGNSIIIFLSVFCVFTLSSYLFTLMNLGEKYHRLKIALSFLIAGILGNTLDRISYGKTIDFIPGLKSYFNFADILLVTSISYLICLILKKNSFLFFPESLRRNFSINKLEQRKVAILFSLTAFLTSLLFGVFIYTFFKYNKQIDLDSYNEFLILYSMITILNCLFFYFFGYITSHKSIGALYAFEQFIHKLINNEPTTDFKLRENDDYKHLEQLALKLKQKIKNDN